MRDSPSTSFVREVNAEVKRLSTAREMPCPSFAFVFEQTEHLFYQGERDLEEIAEEILDRWNDEAAENSDRPIRSPVGAVTPLVLATLFKPFVARFRREVWGSDEPPFDDDEEAAGIWLELMYRHEQADGFLPVSDGRLEVQLPGSGRQSWPIPTGGILERLYLFCDALARVSDWWRVNDALVHILFGWQPSAVRVQASGMGNYTKKITITMYGPVAEEEIIKAYRRGCEIAHITPKPLSSAHYRLLYLVHYLMPKATWQERFATWLEWAQEDKSLPTYGARLKNDGTIEKPEAYKNLKNEYRRAMNRQSWTGEVPKLMREPEFSEWTREMIKTAHVKRPRLPPWEEPGFDSSWFVYPEVDIEALDKICNDVRGLRSPEIKTFWQWRSRI
jgi:hypothetical protein